MLRKIVIALALTTGLSAPALAGAKDYAFSPVDDHVPASKSSTIKVRLIHIPTQTPVTNAVIFQPKLEMPMAGMAPMGTTVKAGAPDGSGAYILSADLAMAGSWTLTLSAKVQGEAETITGSMPIMAVGAAMGH